jgi:hypothetical protein
MRRRRGLWLALGFALVLAVARAHALEALPPDWSAVAAEQHVVVITTNADGTPHETTVWLAVVAGQGYIRTGDTRWYPNIERIPDVVVRVAGKDYPLRAELASDAGEIRRVTDAFSAKYGWSDRVIHWFFTSSHVLRLAPRTT